jgi:SAM-dependent methyltransferase
MVNKPPVETRSAEYFQRQWQTYRKAIENNYMFHREIYDLLHGILVDEAPRPFRFLDLACGDASASVGALQGTDVAHYHGIDLSQPALDLAQANLAVLGCAFTLEERDFVAALHVWSAPVDVVWIGQSLHHLRKPEKLALFRDVRRVLGAGGLLLVWEPTRLEGEDREGWMRRFELRSRPLWGALTEEEWSAIVAHNRAADYPETAAVWRSLGRVAGFAEADQLFVAPTELARVYRFRA